MAKDTKERILDEALRQFSQKGYDGTNIRELTASLGLVKSSMYKHFKSKEEIWNSLLDKMIAYYAEHFGSAENLPPVPDTLDELVAMTLHMVDFTVHDERVVMTRKLLSIEQYRDERASQLATKHFLTGLTEMFTHIFEGMMNKGLLRSDDPEMLAFAYTAPISALIHLCDRESKKTDKAVKQIKAFSEHFVRVYGAASRADTQVRRLTEMEIPTAHSLAWTVFREYEAPDYSLEGTEEFRKCLNNEKYLDGIIYYGAFDGEQLVGMVGIRRDKCHICFCFVDGKYHRRGIGTKMLRQVLSDFSGKRITLNSSPYGLPFYKAFGFTAADSEQTVNGIRFTPMEYNCAV